MCHFFISEYVSLTLFHTTHPPSPSALTACPRYEDYQPFLSLNAEYSITAKIPDGDWTLWVNAPYGGVRGSVLTSNVGISRLSVGASSTVTIASFGGCLYANDAENSTCTRVRRLLLSLENSLFNEIMVKLGSVLVCATFGGYL